MEYPKIETLYNRDEKTFKVKVDELRLPEFELIKRWHITEKVDGTNVRVFWNCETQTVTFGGRTDAAQMPVSLMTYLQGTFHPEMFSDFTANAILYGEGYGPKIQKGGGSYRNDVSFRLFDVSVGSWWLETDVVERVAERMGIATVPWLGVHKELPRSTQDLDFILGGNCSGSSVTALQDGGSGCRAEGIVARTSPLLLTRSGQRLMWKLKYKDF